MTVIEHEEIELTSGQAAEKALNELKALPQTSEAQLGAGTVLRRIQRCNITDPERDLRNRPSVIQPLVIACRSRNAKVAGSGINCLQRLVVTKALPKACLKDVLGAFRDCSSLGKLSNKNGRDGWIIRDSARYPAQGAASASGSATELWSFTVRWSPGRCLSSVFPTPW